MEQYIGKNRRRCPLVATPVAIRDFNEVIDDPTDHGGIVLISP